VVPSRTGTTSEGTGEVRERLENPSPLTRAESCGTPRLHDWLHATGYVDPVQHAVDLAEQHRAA
jgi:hypothetical protein